MKRAFIIVFIFLFACAPASSASSDDKPLTLSDCYALALKRSETIAIDAEHINEADARFTQALGTALPHVSFSSTDTKRDASSSSLYPLTSYERKFVFKQTLFSGFREFIAMSGSKNERGQRVNEKERAEQLLFVDVSDAFYLLNEEQEDMTVLKKTRGALIERVRELRERERLGRSRKSEVVNAQARLYSIEAEIESVKTQETVTRNLLEFLIGRPVRQLDASRGADFYPEKESYYIAKMVLRPDVMAKEDALEVARKKTGIAKSDFLPTISAEGNYYASRNTTPANSKWNASLNVDVPIFEGTETHGAVKEASAKEKISELELTQAKRLAEQEIRDSYAKFTSAISVKTALKKAYVSALMNYNLQSKDYKLNLVNNLDVLEAIQALQDARRNYIHAFYETKRLYWQLCAATGEATTEKLK